MRLDIETIAAAKQMTEELKSVCKNVKHPREGKAVYIGSTWRDFETEKDGKFGIHIPYYHNPSNSSSQNGQKNNGSPK